MKTLLKVIPAVAATTLLIAAVGAASASAAECKGVESGKVGLCIEGKLATGEVPFTGKLSGGGEATWRWTGQVADCAGSTSSGAFLPEAKNTTIKIAKLGFQYTSCHVSAGCEFAHPLVLEKLAGQASAGEFRFYPESGSLFGTMEFKGTSCFLEHSSQIRSLKEKPKEGPICSLLLTGTEATSHTEECKGGPGANNITIGGQEATYGSGESLTLTGANLGKKWSIVKG